MKLVIQAGKWKGKSIPTPPEIKGHSHFTPANLKKACFSILESAHLEGSIDKSTSLFVDLCAGSGQVGLEAISRGWRQAYLVELARERFRALRKVVGKYAAEITLYNRDAFRFSLPESPDWCTSICYFLDLPYSFWQTKAREISKLLTRLQEEMDAKNYIFLVQSHTSLQRSDFEEKKYGNNYLSVYRKI
ncbi:MAG: RsmD family RNA methyltransferase [Spirochaetota bacterium]